MSREDADTIQNIIEQASSWPVWAASRIGGVSTGTYAQAGQYGTSLRDIALWVALRESDRGAIRELIGWRRDREYRVDPVAERVAEAYADLLYSEEPEFFAPNAEDQEKLDESVDSNFLTEQLRRWVDLSVTEGEVWWRVFVDLDMSSSPIVEAHSRLDVIPLFFGRKLKGAGFVSNILTQTVQFEKQLTVVVWRHIEIQTEGYVRHLLYKGTVGTLGRQEEIGSDPFKETEGLPNEWDHGKECMFAGRIPNKLGRDYRLGVSQLNGSKDLILDLNEARSIMAENARNTAKARMIVSADMIDEFGEFDAGKDVYIKETLDETIDAKQSVSTVLEYKFQAEELMVHIHDLEATIFARCGLAEQFVQTTKGGGGQAYTGTALRTRLIPTTLAASGKAKFWDRGVPEMLKAMALAASIPKEQGGCGQTWTEPDGVFTQKRGTILPSDPNEETQRHVMAVQGEIESIEQAVRESHPEWEDAEIMKEVEKIKEEHAGVIHYSGKLEGGGGDPNEPPGGQATADTPPVAGTQSASLRDTTKPRQPGTRRGVDGQSPGKQSPVVTAGGAK